MTEEKRFEKSVALLSKLENTTKFRIYDNEKEDAYFVIADEHTVDCLVELLNKQEERIQSLEQKNELLKAGRDYHIRMLKKWCVKDD